MNKVSAINGIFVKVIHLDDSLVQLVDAENNVVLDQVWKRDKFVQKDIGDHGGQKINNQEKNKAEGMEERQAKEVDKASGK